MQMICEMKLKIKFYYRQCILYASILCINISGILQVYILQREIIHTICGVSFMGREVNKDALFSKINQIYSNF